MTDQSTNFPFWSGSQAEQERLQYAIQAAQVGTWNLDINQQQLWWDERCRELFGYEGQNVVSYSQMLMLVDEEDRPRIEKAIESTLNLSSTGHYDVQFRVSGASLIDPPRWLHAQGRAYVDIMGSAYRLSGVVRDITAQVRTRQQLEISKARFRSLVVNSPTATVFFVGRDIVIDTVNAPMLQIWGKDESVMGQPLQQVMPQLAGQPFVELLQRVYDTGESYHNDKAVGQIMVDGQWQESWFNFSCNPVYAQDGTIFGLINTANDVTAQVVALRESEQRYRLLSEELEIRVAQRTRELAEANEDLKRTNDNLQQFAYVASHDLQEPLRKIQQFGALLKTEYANQSEQENNYIDRMQLAAGRMSNLIRDLLIYSRISTREQVVMSIPLDSVLAQTLVDLELVISESQAVIDAEPLPVVMGDALQLGQLFQNLINNALKFSRVDNAGNPAIPHITIRTQRTAYSQLPPALRPARQAEAYHRIDISDNGVGFDEKYLDRIFQVFQRLHRKNEFVGTGIGLAICQRVVNYHGGLITASSQLGQGATFSVYLPA
ncbi:sensor histidine kinase [Fibrella forsythiae]|uniref:histidine kinase n=1 Tax=Fibrella forsythiae TaxID=2817061 RepID=A0ABS3JRR1_9BACT|nr:ATP-binding protein [Fibrella forsythiae]MBO0952673.1 PAS domain S-box protein [Fibrella forsythiae]